MRRGQGRKAPLYQEPANRNPLVFFIPPDGYVPGAGWVPAAVQKGGEGMIRMTGDGRCSQPWYWGEDRRIAERIAANRNRAAGIEPAEVAETITTVTGLATVERGDGTVGVL